MNLMVADNKLLFIFSTISNFEYISMVPTLLAKSGIIQRTEFVKLTIIARFVSMYKFERILSRRNQEVWKQIYGLLLIVLNILLIISSLIYYVEEDPTAQWHEFLYFMIVTSSTVGFGDRFPRTDFGRFLVVITITMLLALIIPKT